MHACTSTCLRILLLGGENRAALLPRIIIIIKKAQYYRFANVDISNIFYKVKDN